MRRLAGSSRVNRGQAVAEFAIAAVPMLLLLLGIIQFAWIYNAQVGLTNAIRDAARHGSTLRTTTDTEASATAAAAIDNLTSKLGNYVAPYDPTRLDSTSAACVSQHADGTLDSGGDAREAAFVEVTAVYDHPLVVPIVGAIIDGFDGLSNGSFRIAVTTELRIDSPDGTAPALTATACEFAP